jgi:hypothetical protein
MTQILDATRQIHHGCVAQLSAASLTRRPALILHAPHQALEYRIVS